VVSLHLALSWYLSIQVGKPAAVGLEEEEKEERSGAELQTRVVLSLVPQEELMHLCM